MVKLSSGCEKKLKIILEKRNKINNIVEIDDSILGYHSNDLKEYFGAYWKNGKDIEEFKYLMNQEFISYKLYNDNPFQIYQIKVLYNGLTYFEKIDQVNKEKKAEKRFTIKTLIITNFWAFILGIIASILATIILSICK